MTATVPVAEMGTFVPTASGGSVSFVCLTMQGCATLHAINENLLAVASFNWSIDGDGEVTGVYVHEEGRRKGVASMLWEVAKELSESNGWPQPAHSPGRTEDGDAWARAVGGDLPAREGGAFEDESGFGFGQ